MNIIETNLDFGGLSYRSSTSRIILHHAEASTCSPEDIHRWHKANGWAGAGYHFLVRKDGKVYRLRPEWAIGSHAQGANSNSLGICAEGSFMTETMSDVQRDAIAELVEYLKAKYGISTVLRHMDVGSTNCPGTNYPFEEIVNPERKPAPKESEEFNMAECLFYIADDHEGYRKDEMVFWNHMTGFKLLNKPGGSIGSPNLLRWGVKLPVVTSKKSEPYIRHAYNLTEADRRNTYGNRTIYS